MTENPGQAQRFSWKRGAAHVGVALVLFAIAGAIAAAATAVDPETAGQRFGEFILLPLGLVAFSSWLWQRGRRGYASVFGALALVAAAAIVALPVIEARRVALLPLTSAETAPLEIVDIGGAPHFRHPTLGFAFPQPNPRFVESSEAQAAMRGSVPDDPSTHVYALAEQFPGSLVLVTILKANRVDRAELESFVGAVAKIGARADATEIENRTIWEPSFRGAEVHFVVADSNHFRLHAWVDDFDRPGVEYVVALVTMSLGDDAFADTIAGIRTRTAN
jgi:hypothetical protein